MSRFGDISLGEMKIMVTNITALALIYFPTPPHPFSEKVPSQLVFYPQAKVLP